MVKFGLSSCEDIPPALCSVEEKLSGNQQDSYVVATPSDGSRWTHATKNFSCLLNLYLAWWLYHMYS